ncbi:MAG TPA: right-handed parallel beta-helix repeat-containing protein [Blastocatellia bacterium]|nr:right-handed parallel beta-helix repeat-containing protein [Blastocatellia bacterium]
MKLTRGKILVGLTVLALLIVPELALTQGPGGQGRVLNVRLRQVYADISTALADPNIQSGDRLLIAGAITETGDIDISGGGNVPGPITIVSQSRLAFVARVTVSTCTNGVVDLRNRAGAVTWIGGIITVPDGCAGFFDDGTGTGAGNPVTIQGVTIQGESPTTSGISGIVLQDQGAPGGPFRILSNRITGEFNAGIELDGTDTSINVTIRGNRITNTGDAGGTCTGIQVTDTTGSVVVERNRVDGGDSAGALTCTGAGIVVEEGNNPSTPGVEDVTIQRNTVVNYGAATGILIDDSSNVVVKSNVIRDNDTGLAVDPTTCSTTPFPLINNNNITGSTTLALDFGTCGYDLDATNNWWGANTGPADAEGDASCGSPTPPTSTNCNTAAGAGGDINAAAKAIGTPDCCGGGACNNSGFVKTCPFKLFAIFGIGA